MHPVRWGSRSQRPREHLHCERRRKLVRVQAWKLNGPALGHLSVVVWGSLGTFPVARVLKNLPANVGDVRCGFDSWIGKIPWRMWQPTPVFLPGEALEQRSLKWFSLWDHKESDMTEATLACSVHAGPSGKSKRRLSRANMMGASQFRPDESSPLNHRGIAGEIL